MKSKTVKTIALLGLGYLAWKTIKGGGLMGLGDDSIPYDINPPVMQYPPGYSGGYGYGGGYGGYPQYGYGYSPYQSYNPYAYSGGYGGAYSQYPYGYSGGYSAPGFSFNPYGGQSVYGQYIPRVVTASGGIQGWR